MENLQALRAEIENMVITDTEQAKRAEQILEIIDRLEELLAEFSNY